MDKQGRVDAVDAEMASRLLPDTAVRALGRWWDANKAAHKDGTPGAHTVRYTPARWAGATPWPSRLAPVTGTGDAEVSRAEVAAAVADALEREAFREALIATYVWGKGKRGIWGESGPSTLHKILSADGLDAALAEAVTTLREAGAREAYAGLLGRGNGLGPAFFTKFLYFAGQSLPTAQGPAPLILDRVLAGRLHHLAAAVGRETGIDPDGAAVAWAWKRWNWSPHRYGVYLSFMEAAARQLADTKTWPSCARPDLLERALFATGLETHA
ncbi:MULTISPECIES: hypothetical protein [unclassified Streptomyces]|uniref:8-oxoguanine DNA glycosylase OGG fold protein n=1 Tax=unclassified Streptomyces TaxID=2593676 RepID=UPI0035E1C5E6